MVPWHSPSLAWRAWPGPARARNYSGTLLHSRNIAGTVAGDRSSTLERILRQPRRTGVVESAHCRPRFSAHRSSQVESADLQLPSLVTGAECFTLGLAR